MGWCVGIDIYTKKEKEDWKAEVTSNYWFRAKTLCSLRGTLDDDIEEASLTKEDRDTLELLEKKNDIVVSDYVATVSKEDWEKLNKEPDFESSFNGDENRFYISCAFEETVKKHQVDGAIILKTPENEREKKFVSVYKKNKISRGYNGNFYDSSSFFRYADKVLERLKELIVDKANWEKTRKSLDYLKLSLEEKQNVDEEFQYIEEEIEETLSKYNAAISMAGVLEFYEKEYYTSVVAYMYGDG